MTNRLFYIAMCLLGLGCLWTKDLSAQLPKSQQAESQRIRNERMDSLLEAISHMSGDIQKIDALTTFAWDQIDRDYKIAQQSAKKAIEIAQPLQYQRGLFNANYVLGQVYTNYAQDYTQGLAHLTEALQSLDELPEKDPRKKMSILGLIGFIHNRQENLAKSLEYYNQAIDEAEIHGLDRDYSDYCTYVADVMESQGMEEEALSYYAKAYQLEEKHNFEETKPSVKVALGRYKLLLKDYAEAENFYLEALEDFQSEGVHRWSAYVYSALCDLWLEVGEAPKAITFANQGLQLAQKHHLTKEIADNHEMLVEAYDSAGNYQAALYHYRELTRLRNEMFTLDKAKEIASIQNSYEGMIRENRLLQEAYDQEIKLNRIRIISIASIVGLASLAVLAFILYRAYRQKQKVNAQLTDRVELKDLALSDVVKQLKNEIHQHTETQERLKNSNAELSHFIYRTSHDLKGPLTAITGLSQLAISDLKDVDREEVIEKIAETSSRLSKILDRLIQVSMLTEAPVEKKTVQVQPLIQGILQDFKSRGLSQGVEIQTEVQPGAKFLSDQRLLTLILSSLVENALIYRDEQKNQATVRIQVQPTQEGYTFEISDNGIGISSQQQKQVFEMFYKSNSNRLGDGLGLYFVSKAVERLGGNIQLQSQIGEGTSFRLFIPA